MGEPEDISQIPKVALVRGLVPLPTELLRGPGTFLGIVPTQLSLTIPYPYVLTPRWKFAEQGAGQGELSAGLWEVQKSIGDLCLSWLLKENPEDGGGTLLYV